MKREDDDGSKVEIQSSKVKSVPGVNAGKGRRLGRVLGVVGGSLIFVITLLTVFDVRGRWLRRVLGAVGGSLIFVITLLTVFDVAGRALLNRPLQDTVEISSFLLVGIVFLSLSHAEDTRTHIRVELLDSRLSPKQRAICDVIVFLLGTLFFGLMAWYGTLTALESTVRREATFGATNIPLYPARWIMVIGAAVFSLQLLGKAATALRMSLGKGNST